MIRKLSSGQYWLYSRKVDPKTGKRRNLGTFKSRSAAEKHERDVQYFKRHWRMDCASPAARDALRAAATISLFSRAHDPPRQYQQAARPPDSVH